MPEIVNQARRRMDAGEVAIGVGLRQARTVDIGPIMKSCGYDWLFIDMEHNTMTLDAAAQMCVAAQAAGIAPLVRVHALALHDATRALDGGALGVVVPHVDTPKRAAEVADLCKYPPVGHRSITGALPQLGFESLSIAETTEAVNAATLVVVMLETPRAIANAAAIAATPGVDALLVGTNDLTIEMGIPGEVGHARVAAAYKKVVAACAKHGKAAGLGGVYRPDLLERYVGMGFQLVLAGSDLPFMTAAASERAAFVRGLAPAGKRRRRRAASTRAPSTRAPSTRAAAARRQPAAAQAAAPAGKRRAGRPSRWAGMTVRATRKTNPRRKGADSWRAYNFILSRGGSCTYEEFRDAGHGAHHLRRDVARGDIVIE